MNSRIRLEKKGNLILLLGADWWGSDARALAVALRQRGNCLIEAKYEDFLPLQWSGFFLKVLRRLIRPWFVQNYNQVVAQQATNPAIDFVLVFKGKLLQAATIRHFLLRGTPVYCLYPDVSYVDHGPEIRESLPLYDCVFTTKSYHLEDVALLGRVQQMRLVSHGYDPDVHRPVIRTDRMNQHYGCDVSFVGCWSPKKERLVSALIAGNPKAHIKLWGPGWGRANAMIRQYWTGRGAYGDEMAIIYQCSKINLGLLSEEAADTTSGDQTTVRTWQIPATGSFLLHEDTAELRQYFEPGLEVATFTDGANLSSQTKHYLSNNKERNQLAAAGWRRCTLEQYTYASAAQAIIEYHEQHT